MQKQVYYLQLRLEHLVLAAFRYELPLFIPLIKTMSNSLMSHLCQTTFEVTGLSLRIPY